MPRIVPLQLLKCLKVLLDDNGGILSESEVKRIAGLMTKYSKKLVSKCIYVQILKCTKTELLGEFMGAGGWTLVHMWLNDAIRAMNWPLVQEILELLLLCPVDVDRLKSNSAPKLVRGLCKDGGIEGVRILAKRLVEQWLKVVTADSSVAISSTNTTINPTASTPASTTGMPPQIVSLENPALAAATTTEKNASEKAATTTPAALKEKIDTAIAVTKPKPRQLGSIPQEEPNEDESEEYDDEEGERDPLADIPNDVTAIPSYGLTPAQKKANEAGLVYKIILKDGQQVLTKVDSSTAAKTSASPTTALSPQKQTKKTKVEKITGTIGNEEDEEEETEEEEEEEDSESVEANEEVVENEDEEGEENEDENDQEQEQRTVAKQKVVKENAEISDAVDNEEGSEKKKAHKLSLNNSEITNVEKEEANKTSPIESRELLEKSVAKNENDKISKEEIKAKESLKDKIEKKLEERSGSRDSKDSKEREGKEKSERDKERRSSSSLPNQKSSSSSSSKSSNHSASSSSSNKTKSSSSSSSSDRRSTNDKHRSDKDKERSSSSKSKERHNNSSSSSTKSKSSSSSSSSSKSSSSSGSSSKDHRPRDKERDKTTSSSLASPSSSPTGHKKEKENTQNEKDKSLSSSKQISMDKLSKLSKKFKTNGSSDESSPKPVVPTSITIPSKKASMSIEIRRDSEKTKTVKTYKSQFRSHGLTEEAPPPPSRKGLKKPLSTISPGTSIPLSLPSSMKRSSLPDNRDSSSDKKSKIDINNIGNTVSEKPGSIKLIAPKKISTLVETNIFSDALSAATGVKRPIKRKRPITPKDAQSPPTSPDAPKVAPLKFYQDTLDETNKDDSKDSSTMEKSETENNKEKDDNSDKDNVDDDDDIPLKKVKEDIEQKVLKEQKAANASSTDNPSSDNDEANGGKPGCSNGADEDASLSATEEQRKPGPGCGPNGPPGVLTLHRRKGPKKKLSWRPQEELEQIRYFELDETERVNVTKTFMDMKNMERFSERDAIRSRRGFNHEDNMEPQIAWKPLVEIDGVPPHPDGNQSKERKIQADREQMTLRALYFSRAMIPDSPAEAEFEPHYAHDIPVIPLDDITGNPDAVNDFTSMKWPDPKGSPREGENIQGGGLNDLFGGAPFNAFMNPFVPPNGAPPGMAPMQQQPNLSAPPPLQMMQATGVWAGQGGRLPIGPMGGPNNHFNGPMTGSPTMENLGVNASMGPGGPMIPHPPNFMGARNQFIPPGAPNQFGPGGQQFGPPHNFGGPNFRPMGPNPLMGPNGMRPGPHMGVVPLMSGPILRPGGGNRNGGNWRAGGTNFDNNNGGGGGGGGNGGGNWRPAGPGQNRNDWTNNTGLCKAYQRGHCRLGKSCKYVHSKKKRL